MPLITNPVTCDAPLTLTIQQKINDPSFTHNQWGCDDLLEFRSHVRAYYRDEQQGLCAYCKNTVSVRSANNAHIEHIVAKSLYRDFIFEAKNLCVICADCNEIKRSQEVLNEVPDTLSPLTSGRQRIRYPTSSNAFLIVHPHYDEWDDHLMRFGYQYIDKTTKGGNTIVMCKLNRYFHQNFNMDDNFVDDADLVSKMTAFIESRSATQKARILESLKADLSMML